MLAAPKLSPAHADTVGYLVNVTTRPGYNFPNADAAVAYGGGICAFDLVPVLVEAEPKSVAYQMTNASLHDGL